MLGKAKRHPDVEAKDSQLVIMVENVVLNLLLSTVENCKRKNINQVILLLGQAERLPDVAVKDSRLVLLINMDRFLHVPEPIYSMAMLRSS